jgi:hypothetical protein
MFFLKRNSLISVIFLGVIVVTARANSADLVNLVPLNGPIGTTVSIPLKDGTTPANDLIYVENGKSRKLSATEALELQTKSQVDLSRLEPANTYSFYTGTPSTDDSKLDEALEVVSGDTVSYAGSIPSAVSGLFTPNISSASGKAYTLIFSRTLHTILLRKAILRRLGYRVPAMKYLSKVKVRFPLPFILNSFVSDLFQDTFGLPSKWCSVSSLTKQQDPKASCGVLKSNDPDGSDPLVITLHDVAVTEANVPFPNLAILPPAEPEPAPNADKIKPFEARVTRSLALIYDFVNVKESIPQTDWAGATVQSGNATFFLSDIANFSCSHSDAIWILNKISALSKDEIKEVVNKAYFPDPIAQLLVERLSSVRNYLSDDVFAMKVPKLPVVKNINIPPYVKNDKVVQKRFPGYASDFAFGDPPSPLKGVQWYVANQLESNLMENLITRANNELPNLNLTDQLNKHNSELFQKAFSEFQNTGQVTPLHFKPWTTKIIGGGLSVSRNIIFGNYLGTNNLVQLADNYGYYMNAGIYVGVDGVGSVVPSMLVQGSISYNLTHIRHIIAFKDAVTETPKTLFVPALLSKAAKIFNTVSQLQYRKPAPSPDALSAEMSKDLAELSKYIDVQDSLILTKSITGTQDLGALAQLPFKAISVGPSVGASEIVLSRIHFYRRDADTLVVFQDEGELVGWNFTFTADVGTTAQLPFLIFTAKSMSGAASSNIFTATFSSHVQSAQALNDVMKTSTALASAFKSKSVKTLEEVVKPTYVAVDFTDRESSFQFFHYVRRTLKTNGNVKIVQPNGNAENYLALTDGKQTGLHYQLFGTQLATYILQRLTGNYQDTVDTQASTNPGQSIFGRSETRDAVFQGVLNQPDSMPYVRVQYRWEGWEMAPEAMANLVDTQGARFGFNKNDDPFYPAGYLNDTKDIKLYKLAIVINFYERALKNILSMSAHDEMILKFRHRVLYSCAPWVFSELGASHNPKQCKAIDDFESALAAYRKGIKNVVDLNKTILEITSNLEAFVDFNELQGIVGGVNNIYVSSQLSGFREGSEQMFKANSDGTPATVDSNTKGLKDKSNPSGVVDGAQNILKVQTGEFYMQWIRDVL